MINKWNPHNIFYETTWLSKIELNETLNNELKFLETKFPALKFTQLFPFFIQFMQFYWIKASKAVKSNIDSVLQGNHWLEASIEAS